MEARIIIILILKVKIHEEQTSVRRILQLNYTDNITSIWWSCNLSTASFVFILIMFGFVSSRMPSRDQQLRYSVESTFDSYNSSSVGLWRRCRLLLNIYLLNHACSLGFPFPAALVLLWHLCESLAHASRQTFHLVYSLATICMMVASSALSISMLIVPCCFPTLHC